MNMKVFAKLIVLLVLIGFNTSIFAQNKSVLGEDSYEILIKKGLTRRYFQNDERLTMKRLNSMLIVIPQAAVELKKAKSDDFIMVLIGIGSSLISTGIVLQQFRNRNSPSLFLIGALIGAKYLIQLPFRIGYRKHIQNAIDIYNTEVVEYQKLKLEFGFSVDASGLGISLFF
jgi:hypothetical protein